MAHSAPPSETRLCQAPSYVAVSGRAKRTAHLLGLAVATKPIYLLLFIAIAFVLFLKRRHYAGGFADWKQRILFWVALAVPLALFVLTILPPDVSFSHLAGIAESYQGRASQGHFFANIFENAKRFFSEDALLYTLVLSGIAAFAVPWRRMWRGEWRTVHSVLVVAAVLMLLFFLQSVGWNRYLVF